MAFNLVCQPQIKIAFITIDCIGAETFCAFVIDETWNRFGYGKTCSSTVHFNSPF